MHWGPAIVFVPQMIISFGNGLLLPGAIAGAVSVRPQAAGTAAGIIGFIADGARRGGHAIRRHAAGEFRLGGAAGAADGGLVVALAIGFGLLVRRA